MPRTALGIATLPQAAAALDDAKHSVASTSRQAIIDRAARHVEAARADLAAVLAEEQSASEDQIAALAAVVAVLRISGMSISPGEAAFTVDRTPATVINWCRRFNIGIKSRDRWVVDPLRLAALLLGCAA